MADLEDEEKNPKPNLHDLIDEGENITKIRKESVFSEAITKEDQEIIKQRVELQRKHYQKYEGRERMKKVAKVQSVHPYVTEEEIAHALKECNGDEVRSSFADLAMGLLMLCT